MNFEELTPAERRSDYKRFILVGHVGPLNTVFTVAGVKDERSCDPIFRYRWPTEDLTDIVDVINESLKLTHEHSQIEIARAVLCGSGPISRKRNYIRLTHADFELNKQDILSRTELRQVYLLNDFEAISFGISWLQDDELILLPHFEKDLSDPRHSHGARAVIGAGDGLGMSYMRYDTTKHMYEALPSEGGHASLNIQSQVDFEIAQYLKENYLVKDDAFPENERVLSKKGMARLFAFFAHREHDNSETVKHILQQHEDDQCAEIIAHRNDCAISKLTITTFIRFYARAARNLAFTTVCYSGLYLVGDVSNALRPELEDFMKEFLSHDERSDVLRKVPVYLVSNHEALFYGCVNVAINFYNLK